MKPKTSTIKLLYIDNANTAHRLTLDEFITRFNAGAINADAGYITKTAQPMTPDLDDLYASDPDEPYWNK